MVVLGFVRRRWAVPAVFALAVVGIVSGVAPVSSAGAQSEVPEQVLERDMRGEAAIQALGDRLPEVAALNDMAPAEFRTALRADAMLWVDRTGRLLFVDELDFGGDHDRDEAPLAHGSFGSATPPSDVFGLESRPGARRVIVLDFDGHDATGTAWDGKGQTTQAAPYDADGIAGFSDAERAVIYDVWQRVAEDYAPFDINVTTKAPPHDPTAPADIIHRTDGTDQIYGTRVVVTPSKTYNCNCGGVAYVGVYDFAGDSYGRTHNYYQPAWVFAGNGFGVGLGAKNIAEAASHEAGHNLGLSHDGTRRSAYYTGHGDWAPIMGVGYYEPITQWSRGEYSGANNKEDDYSVVQANGGPLAEDDWPSTTALVSPRSGVIESRGDSDSFTVDVVDAGVLQVRAGPATVSPNLDIRLRLAGNDLDVVADPQLVLSGSRDSTSGLDAVIEAAVTTGTYTITVEGTGWGDPGSTGYSDYGSVGRYTITAVHTAGDTIDDGSGGGGDGGTGGSSAPAAPEGFGATASGSDVKLTWTDASIDEDGFRIERSYVHKNGQTRTSEWTVSAGTTEYDDTGLSSAEYTYRLQSYNAQGVSAWVEANAVVAGGGGKPTKGGKSSRIPIS